MAKLLPVKTNPDPTLRKRSTEVQDTEISAKEMCVLLKDMAKTMLEKDGIGLAAPQIGKNIRLIVINTKDGVLVMFNPVITKKSLYKAWEQEGCLSLPNIFGDVKRHKKVVCIYKDKDGKHVEVKAEGLMARVIQHEIDHLDGILFIDKAKNIIKARPNS